MDSDTRKFFKSFPIYLAIIGFFMCGVTFLLNYFEEQENLHTVEIIYIESLDYLSEDKGNFIFGFGSIRSTDYYVVYKVHKDGAKELERISAEETLIYDVLEPEEQAYCEITRNGFGSVVSSKLYVPVNSIQREYDFSLGE